MEAELDASLGYEKNQKGEVQISNKRNGHSPKTLKSQYGEFQIDVPRDREAKYQRNISGIEEKVISLYARRMSTRDIHDQIQELYGMELSAEMVSKITDRILPEEKTGKTKKYRKLYTVYKKLYRYFFGNPHGCWDFRKCRYSLFISP